MQIETITADDTRCEIAPERGAIVTQLEVGGRALLYMDQETLRDPEKNVRGGVPFLFPTPGKLTGDRWDWGGRGGGLPQHGWARRLPWEVRARSSASLTLGIRWEADEAQRLAWPYRCELELRYTVREAALRIDLSVRNLDGARMPFGLGFHPYFAVPLQEKAQARIPTEARSAFDNLRRRVVTVDAAAFSLAQPEVDLHLLDHSRSEASLLLAGGRAITISASPELSRWVIWTLSDKPFVCLEPWSSGGDALNRDEQLLVLEPGSARAFFFEIAAR